MDGPAPLGVASRPFVSLPRAISAEAGEEDPISASNTPPDPHRRRFLARLGAAGLVSLSAPALAMAQSKPGAGASSATPGATPAAAPPDSAAAVAKPPEISEDARGLAAIIRRRYGIHLTPDQLEAVTREIENRVQGGKTLRAAKLKNGEEPDFTFHA